MADAGAAEDNFECRQIFQRQRDQEKFSEQFPGADFGGQRFGFTLPGPEPI